MKPRTRFLILITVCFIAFGNLPGQTKRPLELADMFKIRRVSAPCLSPDGNWIVYTVTIPDLAENKNRTDLWLVSADGKTHRQLTSNPAHDRNAVWSPDGSM